MIASADACGTLFGAFRRYTVRADGWTEERMVCQRRCGTRACPHCDAEIRKRQAWRVSGPWRMFITVGIPADALTCRQAWRILRRARALLFKRLERAAADPDVWWLRVHPEDERAAREHRAKFKGKRERKSPLDYAWALEPHESGYPHLHFIVNATYVNYSKLREVWGECVGREILWSRHEDVYDKDGVCHYLADYVAKCEPTPDLAALMYRQRMWATSRPLQVEEKREWIEEPGTTPEAAKAQAEDSSNFDESRNWSLQEGKDGAYQIWRREWYVEDAVDAWLMHRETGFVFDPERHKKPPREREPEPPAFVCLMSIALDEADPVATLALLTLTNLVKVG